MTIGLRRPRVGPHAHRDMEIITYVLEGALLHRDSTGESHILKPNESQTMTAGNGIVHSEFNASDVERRLDPNLDYAGGRRPHAFLSADRLRPAEKLGKLRLLAGPGPSPQATVIYTIRMLLSMSPRFVRARA